MFFRGGILVSYFNTIAVNSACKNKVVNVQRSKVKSKVKSEVKEALASY